MSSTWICPRVALSLLVSILTSWPVASSQWLLDIKNHHPLAMVACPPPQRLQTLIDESMSSGNPIILPCCYDGLTARLVAQAGFEATFMTGFGVSAARGYPDTQLVSYQEMLQSATSVAEALASVALEQRRTSSSSSSYPPIPIPCIADGDTGYGNAMNAQRTVMGYGRAGMAGIMVEDQVAPKRCGHVSGKAIIPFDQAVTRIKATCDARDHYNELYGGPGHGPLVLARTDALKTDGFEAAIERCLAFREAGADMTFLEAPTSIEEMKEYCRRVDGPKLANMLEQGSTPILPPKELGEMGYTFCAYPLTLLSSSILAMQKSLERIHDGEPTDDLIAPFSTTKDVIGFTQYGIDEEKYRVE